MRILNASQMREADRRTIEDVGISSLVLMENAGRQVVAAMEASFEDIASRRVAVLCGRGNNGGDGFVVARTLRQRGIESSVFLIGQAADVRGDARTNLEIVARLAGNIVEIPDEQVWELHFSEIASFDIIVDAIFGTGLRAPVSGMLQTVVADLNSAEIPVVSIDLPTGLSADTPDLIGDAIDATITVTLSAPKLPLVLPAGESRAGDLVIADIGIPTEVIDSLDGPKIELLTREGIRDLVEPRHPDSHKGDFGRVLLAAGSRGKTGAAALAALGALRCGAGLVTIATPTSCQTTVAGFAPEFMTEGLPETAAGRIDASAIDRVLAIQADVVAVGPGLGVEPGTTAFVRRLVERAAVPLVLDADALNAFAEDPGRLQGREDLAVVITPHPGEMARLVGLTIEEVQAGRLEIARDFAASHHVHVVLKGYRTIIATPEGRRFVNLTGNPGMATGGTGDVLTGMVAAWFAQLLDAEAACKVAVYLHGLAGDLAEADDGEVSMSATDVAGHIGDAILELTARRRAKPAE